MTKVDVKNNDGAVILSNETAAPLTVTDFDPSDLLAGALAKCTSYEVSKFAKKKGYNLENLDVRVDLNRDSATKTANFKVHLDVKGDLSPAEMKQLHKAASKSYINRLLSNNIELEGDVHLNGEKVVLPAPGE